MTPPVSALVDQGKSSRICISDKSLGNAQDSWLGSDARTGYTLSTTHRESEMAAVS